LNKIDLIPPEEREARIAAFVRAMRWQGPVFAVCALSGQGCRPLVQAAQQWLEAHPAPSPAPIAS
jgi:GTP-binding protein